RFMSAMFEAMEGLSWEIQPCEHPAAVAQDRERKSTPPPARGDNEHAGSCGARIVIARREVTTAPRRPWRVIGSAAFLAALATSGWAGLNEGRGHHAEQALQAVEVSYTPPPDAQLPRMAGDARASAPAPRPAPPPALPAFSLERTVSHDVQRAARLFLRGNDLAAQGRWEEAGAAYAEAFALDQRPDYAFNLAVSLERLGRREDALHHYRVALAARDGAHRFDTRVARQRVLSLSQEGSS
ncbi:MAG: hypothetical protein AB7U81_06545, partial [Thiohalomonadaceae bacterium]